MNDTPDMPPRPDDEAPLVLPARRAGPPRDRRPAPPPLPPRAGGSGAKVFLVLFLLLSMFVNIVLVLVLIASMFSTDGDDGGVPIKERHYSNSASASDKVAVIRVEGILMDEMMGYAHKQIDHAAKDGHVKAVVLRINSPGGSVTASDDLHKRLGELKNGSSPRYSSPAKKLVVSMGPMAASGGYYIAMPGEYLFAEQTTTTGSIGVYASLPNVQKLANDHGVKMILVKAGDVKASGSMFHEMSPQERQTYQDMVDDMYGHFLHIVEDGRPDLKGKLTKPLFTKEVPVYDDKGNAVPGKTVPYTRKIADGGGFTATEAKQHGLIDQIGYLEDATKKAASLAGLSDYEVVVYDRPVTLMSLFGASAKQQAAFDPAKLAAAAAPRMWYLAPNSEFAGYFAVLGQQP